MHLASPIDAQRHGIRTVYQELDLLPNLSVAENIMLGREPRRFGAIDWRRMQREAGEVLSGLGLEHRSGVAARRPLARDPAAGRDRARDLHRRARARARRADIQSRRRRGRRAVPRDPGPQGPRRRHPVRLALPRSGVRDLRSRDGAAGRRPRRRVPHGRAAAHRSRAEDARQGRRGPHRPIARHGRAARRQADLRGARPRPGPASAGSTWRSPRARCSVSPACSDRGAPNSRAP